MLFQQTRFEMFSVSDVYPPGAREGQSVLRKMHCTR
jgi:hypothetical protein